MSTLLLSLSSLLCSMCECACCYHQCIHFLLYCSLLSIGDVDGLTALHVAAQECRDECAQLLLQHGADLKLKDANGWTPDVHAVYTGNLSLASALSTPSDTAALERQQNQIKALTHSGSFEKLPIPHPNSATAVAPGSPASSSSRTIEELLTRVRFKIAAKTKPGKIFCHGTIDTTVDNTTPIRRQYDDNTTTI